MPELPEPPKIPENEKEPLMHYVAFLRLTLGPKLPVVEAAIEYAAKKVGIDPALVELGEAMIGDPGVAGCGARWMYHYFNEIRKTGHPPTQ